MNPYSIIRIVDDITYSGINLISNILFITKEKLNGTARLLKRNRVLKSISNDSCLICGNGPSLNTIDFSILDLPVFTANFFFKGAINIPNGPAYHLMIDDAFKLTENRQYLIEAYRKNPQTKFICRYDMKDIFKAEDKDLTHVFFTFGKRCHYCDKVFVDMTGNMTACQNVILMSLQCAIHMGYKNIYLIGCENNFFSDYTHFYDTTKPDYRPKSLDGLCYVDLAFRHYRSIEVLANKMGVTIYNITPNSYIDAFRILSIEEFYNREA